MDISTNAIDLLYLTNASTLKGITAKQKLAYTKADLSLYRKRIFEQTRDILIGKKVEKDIYNAFNEYVGVSISHFKFLDKKEIIQKDYENIKKKAQKVNHLNYGEVNKLVYKNEKPTHYKITDCIKVKRKSKLKKKMIIPQIRDFTKNIAAKSKDKSIAEKDNIIIRYDETKIKKKKKKKEDNKKK